MVEKISKVSNPLTIVAIFSGLAEAACTVALGLVSKELQPTFIWFVICFSTLLVLVFFLTLNFNSKVLYAPSDFRTDDSFISFYKEMRNVDKVLSQAPDSAASHGLPESSWQAELVKRLHPLVSSYLIKVANQRLSSHEHLKILGEIFGLSKDDSSNYTVAAGLFIGILRSLGDNLFTYTKYEGLFFQITISSNTLSLLNERVNEQSQQGGGR